MKKSVKITLDWRFGIAILAVSLLVVGFVVLKRDNPQSPLPIDVQQAITFSPLLIPADSKSFTTTSYHLSKAEDETQVLSYIITTPENVDVTVSEYAQPPQFNDVVDFKQQFLTNVAKQYDSVEASNGTIYLGRQTKNNNRQLGLMIEKGLLIFMNPDQDLSKTQWRQIGDQLELQKVSE